MNNNNWRNVNLVIDRLYLGNIRAATSTRATGERGITHIVSVCSDPIPAELPESGIQHLRIEVEDVDYADLLRHLPRAIRFIHEALSNQGVVLVHCVQGLSRSATVVAAYLMWAQRIHATEALEIVRRARDQIWPNAGFQEQLVLWELCDYNPTPDNGFYRTWRLQLDRRLAAAGLR
ncbi:phosphatases II [Armillaria gallica]|uniref:Phosphatases II n=1 Tax=Armillaria gallica TaxID=47427 RepID=A0A2H3ERL5_ARMGA|nr:protein-tyrosine phosphatase-like protein [Armillaria nabsnona]PBL02314.1 phosphatases II [Armillaria gallica]